MASRDLGTGGTGRDDSTGLAGPSTVEASRRRFLRRAAAGGAVAFGASTISLSALAQGAFAQTSGGGTTVPGTTPGSTPGTALPGTPTSPVEPATVTGEDLVIAQFVQSLQLAAASLCGALEANGKFRPSAAQHARTYQLHHTDHATKMLDFTGGTGPKHGNPALIEQFQAPIAAAGSEVDLARIAFSLEDGLAATHQWALGAVSEWQLASALATILPVTAQQAVSWSRTADPELTSWITQIVRVVPPFQPEAGRFDPAQYPLTAS